MYSLRTFWYFSAMVRIWCTSQEKSEFYTGLYTLKTPHQNCLFMKGPTFHFQVGNCCHQMCYRQTVWCIPGHRWRESRTHGFLGSSSCMHVQLSSWLCAQVTLGSGFVCIQSKYEDTARLHVITYTAKPYICALRSVFGRWYTVAVFFYSTVSIENGPINVGTPNLSQNVGKYFLSWCAQKTTLILRWWSATTLLLICSRE